MDGITSADEILNATTQQKNGTTCTCKTTGKYLAKDCRA